MTRASEPKIAPLPDLDALAEVAARFEAAASEEPLFKSADPSEIIRHVEGKRVILRGTLGVRPAVFRVFLRDPEACQRDWNELQRVWPYMNAGDAQVCTPLACSIKAGIVVLADIPGTPLLELLYDSAPNKRSKWLKPAAQWLRTYTAPTETHAKVETDPWIARAERGLEAQAFNRLRKLEQSILDEIKRLATAIPSKEWRKAISHGDFHPNNLIADGARLTGIDCGGSLPSPIYKDIARFLMHMGRRGMIPSGKMRLGVDAEGIDAFAETFAMGETERKMILPFFLGVEALMRAETRDLAASRIRRAKDMSEALLEDLKAIET
ncbi:MAG: phosphotransferase [Pseudomonadota bacterium]